MTCMYYIFLVHDDSHMDTWVLIVPFDQILVEVSLQIDVPNMFIPLLHYISWKCSQNYHH